MKLFDPVAVVCSSQTLDTALAIRSSLEAFRLRVHFYHCVQLRNATDVLAGRIAPCDYVVLVAQGIWDHYEPGVQPDMGFEGLVDQIDGEWQEVSLRLSPADVPKLVKLEGRKIISTGCASGVEPFGKAFLEAGCSVYIGPGAGLDGDACALFPIVFFYHLLSPERAGAGPCSDREAFERAAAVDTFAKEGTHVFRCYESS